MVILADPMYCKVWTRSHSQQPRKRRTFEHVTPVCLQLDVSSSLPPPSPQSILRSLPPSSHLKCHTVRLPLPADVTTGAASTAIIPTSHTTDTTPRQSGPRKGPHIAGLGFYCVKNYSGLLRTFLAPLSLRTPALPLLPSLST